MDPRHPELVLPRVKELVKQYESVNSNIKKATTMQQISQAEREGALVVQELCLVAPRLHELMVQESRMRRGELVKGAVSFKKETPVAPNQAETVIVKPKPRKKAKKAKNK